MLDLRREETRVRIRKLAAMATDLFYLRRFLKHGVAPAIEHASLLRRLPFDFMVDVGANRGQFSLVCRHINPAAKIVAFEPLPAPARVYRALFADDPNVRLCEAALGAIKGRMSMHVSARDDSSSLLPIAKAQTDNFPGTGEVGRHEVAVTTLMDSLPSTEMGLCNMLKIDVQGFELEVLRSAEPLLFRFAWVYVECSYIQLYEGQALANEIVAYLRDRGFRLSGQFNPSYTRTERRLLQADLLFESVK